MHKDTLDIFSKKNKKTSLVSKKNKFGFFNFSALFSNKILLNKILFTIFMVILIRALYTVPLPGVNPDVLREVFNSASSLQSQYLFTLFTGGRLDSPSIIGLGLAAYINASIIMQLLPYVIPRLKELQKEGEKGKQIINQLTRLITFPLTFIYGFAYLIIISQTDFSTSLPGLPTGSFLIPHAAGSNIPELSLLVFMSLILAGGTILLMWIGEFITEKGIGNGTTLIIMLGIIANLPSLIIQDFQTARFDIVFSQILSGDFSVFTNNDSLWVLPIVIIGLLLTIALIIFINESQRNIQIQYARRVRETEQSASSSLPIRFTVTGVMPVIFAFSFLSVPQLVIPIIRNFESFKDSSFLLSIEQSFLFSGVGDAGRILDINDLFYEMVLFGFIVLFGLFYAFIVLNPEETAENLQKSGGFIPGIRPGKSTQEYFSKVLFRIGLVGSIFLGFVALLPFLARFIISIVSSPNYANLALLTGIGGTSLLILVSGFIEIRRQYAALKVSNSYTGIAS
jgi:preprotein translocase subunit SecY